MEGEASVARVRPWRLLDLGAAESVQGARGLFVLGAGRLDGRC